MSGPEPPVFDLRVVLIGSAYLAVGAYAVADGALRIGVAMMAVAALLLLFVGSGPGGGSIVRAARGEAQ